MVWGGPVFGVEGDIERNCLCLDVQADLGVSQHRGPRMYGDHERIFCILNMDSTVTIPSW